MAARAAQWQPDDGAPIALAHLGAAGLLAAGLFVRGDGTAGRADGDCAPLGDEAARLHPRNTLAVFEHRLCRRRADCGESRRCAAMGPVRGPDFQAAGNQSPRYGRNHRAAVPARLSPQRARPGPARTTAGQRLAVGRGRVQHDRRRTGQVEHRPDQPHPAPARGLGRDGASGAARRRHPHQLRPRRFPDPGRGPLGDQPWRRIGRVPVAEYGLGRRPDCDRGADQWRLRRGAGGTDRQDRRNRAAQGGPDEHRRSVPAGRCTHHARDGRRWQVRRGPVHRQRALLFQCADAG